MEIEKSFAYKGQDAYIFEKEEKKAIAEALKPQLKKIETKIRKIENDPKNEGQVTFKEKQRELFWLKKSIEKIIDEFGN